MKTLCGTVMLLALSSSVSGEPPASIPTCAAHDARTRIKIWAPQFTPQGTLKSRPVASDGEIVFIEFNRLNDVMGCAGAQGDKLYTLSYPNDPNDPLGNNGGLEVNFRGNVQFDTGVCYFSGFYMNEQVMGMHQGWTSTYFRPVDKLDVVMSSKFCIVRGRRNS